MFPMDQVCAHCMSPDNAKIPFAAIDNVLIEPAQRARSFNPCANCAAGGGKLVKSWDAGMSWQIITFAFSKQETFDGGAVHIIR